MAARWPLHGDGDMVAVVTALGSGGSKVTVVSMGQWSHHSYTSGFVDHSACVKTRISGLQGTALSLNSSLLG